MVALKMAWFLFITTIPMWAAIIGGICIYIEEHSGN